MKRFITATLSVVVLLAVVTGVFYRQDLRDHYVARTHRLQPAAQELIDILELTGRGKLLFQASRPEIQGAEDFNNSCSGVHQELTIVLGCYTKRRIYVFDVTDKRLSGAVEVTSAHELLHASYERLSASEKSYLANLLKVAAEKIPKNSRLERTVAQYRRTVSGDHYTNELYAIIGTEFDKLDPRLEKHYKLYFQNRKKIVAFSRQYESVFSRLEKQIEAYDSQLERLYADKEHLEKTIDTLWSSLASSQTNIDTLRQNDKIADYNQAVPTHNSLVSRYNQAVEQLRDVVNRYNSIVKKRNDLAVTQNDLVEQLNSQHQPISQ